MPERELHELGLLFNYYLAKQAGYKVYYPGQNVPHQDLTAIVATHNPDMLVTSIINPMANGPTQYITQLSSQFPNQLILVSGIQVSDLPAKQLPNLKIFSNALKFKELITAKQ